MGLSRWGLHSQTAATSWAAHGIGTSSGLSQKTAVVRQLAGPQQNVQLRHSHLRLQKQSTSGCLSRWRDGRTTPDTLMH